jgi:hypothetical protein
MKESAIQKRVRVALAEIPGCVMFRNNVGMAKYHDGVEMRTVTYGLCTGSSDLIGWSVVNGRAIFTAIETKRPGKIATIEQINFLTAVVAAGGIAGVARSEAEAKAIVIDGQRRLTCG